MAVRIMPTKLPLSLIHIFHINAGCLYHRLELFLGSFIVGNHALAVSASVSGDMVESIVSNNETAQKKFQAMVDAACVYVLSLIHI